MKKSPETLIVIILSLSLAFSVFTCNRKVKARNETISQLKLDNQVSQESINRKNQTITLQDVIITNSASSLAKLTDSIFQLKKQDEKKVKDVVAYYKSILKTSIKEVKIPYVDTASRKKWEDSVLTICGGVIQYYEDSSIIVPAVAIDSTKYFKASLVADKTGITIHDLSIIDNQHVRFIHLKGGLFKRDTDGKRHLWLKPKLQVQVLHTNPLITVTAQNSVYYEPLKKNRWLERGLLIGAGILIGAKL